MSVSNIDSEDDPARLWLAGWYDSAVMALEKAPGWVFARVARDIAAVDIAKSEDFIEYARRKHELTSAQQN